MRYWYYDERTRTALGPHLALFLPKLPGFGPESKIALEGARGAKDWRPAKEIDELKDLFPAAPAPASAPPGEKKKG